MSIAYSIVKHFHIEWVGVSSADTGFYLGPFWMYFGALWLFLSRGNPAVLAYIAPIIGIITTAVIYLAGIKVFNKKIAVISTFLYATLPLIVFYDKKFWNPSLTSLTALMLFFSLYLALKSAKWWLLVAFTFGFAFHVHLSLIPLGLLAIIFGILNIRKIPSRYLLFSGVIFATLLSPLIAFDFFTKGTDLSTPFRIANQIFQSPSRIDPIYHLRELGVTMGRFWYLYPQREIADEVLHSCSPEFLNKDKLIPGVNTTVSLSIWVLAFFSLGIFLFFLLQKTTWHKENSRLLAIFLLVISTGYLFLPNIPLEYYLLGFFPLFVFVPGIALSKLSGMPKELLTIALITLSLAGVYTNLSAKDSFGLTNKKILIEKVANFLDGKTFDLEEEGLCHKFEGWRFLYRAYFKAPLHSSQDKNLGWIYSSEIGKEPGFYKVIMSETRATTVRQKKEIASFESGGFSAYIYKE